MPEYSVVIPVYNEEESVDALIEELTRAMNGLKKPYELIFVNDCSSDTTRSKLEGYQRNAPQTVRIINLPQRSGQTYAMRKGLDSVQGRVAFTLDADLQNDPADIPRLIKKMDEGYDMVCGWRKDRGDRPLKTYLSKFGNFLQRRFTRMPIHDISCTLRAFRKECIPDIVLEWEGQHRFIPIGPFKKGYRIAEIVSHHRQRQFGYSKYSHKRIFRVMVDFFKMLNA